MKLFLLVFLLLYTVGVQEHQQATWLSDHSQLTNSCTTKEYSVKFSYTLKSVVATQLYYHLFALESLFLPGIEQHFLSKKFFSQS